MNKILNNKTFSNEQWRVDNKGIETLDGKYFIRNDRLLTDFDNDGNCPRHMAEKEWVNIYLFLEAYFFALYAYHTNEFDETRAPTVIKQAIERSQLLRNVDNLTHNI